MTIEDGTERAAGKLTGLLRRIADQQGLTPAVHPGFGRLDATHTGRDPCSPPGNPGLGAATETPTPEDLP